MRAAGFDAPSVRFGAFAATDHREHGDVDHGDHAGRRSWPGPVPVVVTNPDGGLAVSDGPYSYRRCPAARRRSRRCSRTPGRRSGGTTLTILGSQFTPDATVLVGGVAATQVQFLEQLGARRHDAAGRPAPTTRRSPCRGRCRPTVPFEYRPSQAAVTACAGDDQDGDGVPDDWETQFGLSSADASDGALDWDGDGRTNLQECLNGTHPRGLYTRYLAEGATGSFFSTRVALVNPGVMPARGAVPLPHAGRRDRPARRRRAGRRAPHASTSRRSPGSSRRTSRPSSSRTPKSSSIGRCGGTGRRAGARTPKRSVPAPALRWYLAEGATHGAFDLFYLIQNPSLTSAASVRIRFLLPVRRADRAVLHGAAEQPVHAARGRRRGARRHRRLGGHREPQRPADHRRARDVFVGRGRVRGRPRQRRRERRPRRSGSSPRARPAAFFDLFLLFANPNASDAAACRRPTCCRAGRRW